MNTRALIMWYDDTPEQRINEHIATLKRNGFQRIYIGSSGHLRPLQNSEGVIRVHQGTPLSYGKALYRTLQYIFDDNAKEKYGILLLNAMAYIDNRLVSRINQIVTLLDVQPIDLFMTTRTTNVTCNKKYVINFHGFITQSKVAIHGDESLGVFFISNLLTKKMPEVLGDTMEEMIDNMCKLHYKIFAITNGCC